MARKARVKSSTGIYHVLVRAVSDISLFSDSEDTTIYLDSLRSLQSKGFCTIYGYALFGTHLHLLIQEGTKEFMDNSRVIDGNSCLKDQPSSSSELIGSVMKRLASTYSYYFNVKYDHYGPIYLDRFKSEPIEDLSTFLACRDFITTQSTDTKGILTNSIPFSVEESLIINHSSLIESSSFIDFSPRGPRITDLALKSRLEVTYGFTTHEEFLTRQDSDQVSLVTFSKSIGANVLQIARITGLTRKVVTRMTSRGPLTRAK